MKRVRPAGREETVRSLLCFTDVVIRRRLEGGGRRGDGETDTSPPAGAAFGQETVRRTRTFSSADR